MKYWITILFGFFFNANINAQEYVCTTPLGCAIDNLTNTLTLSCRSGYLKGSNHKTIQKGAYAERMSLHVYYFLLATKETYFKKWTNINELLVKMEIGNYLNFDLQKKTGKEIISKTLPRNVNDSYNNEGESNYRKLHTINSKFRSSINLT
ncbi:MAG: hypothetical protein AB9833_04225 [Bacteroidales bacterium]